MPSTITLKNIPDEVYERLKASAEANRRSLNSEAIVCAHADALYRSVPIGWRAFAIQEARARNRHG
jgi:hypothetical protein